MSTTVTQPNDPLSRIWKRLSRPFDTPETVDAVLGLSSAVVRQLVGALVATSDEAIELIQAMPHSIRSLATSMESHSTRCRGDLRGPILWSETIAARASSFGTEDLFVCAAPSRAYDIVQNRVLLAALRALHQAATDAQAVSERAYDDETLRWARRNGDSALRYMNHPTMKTVTAERPDRRSINRTRSGKKRATYEPALKLLDRLNEPIGTEELADWSDQRTFIQHSVLMGLVDRLESGGSRLPDFRAEAGVLYAGPMQYRHPRKRSAVTHPSGIVLGSLLIDVPDRLRETNRERAEHDLRLRSGERDVFVVMSRPDIDVAFDRAVALARS